MALCVHYFLLIKISVSIFEVDRARQENTIDITQINNVTETANDTANDTDTDRKECHLNV
jgi:hypothetical protein